MSLMKRAPKGTPTGGQFTAQERPEAPVHLHVGVNAFARPVLTSIAQTHPGVSEVIDDGDSWEVWGEPSSAMDHKHVVMEVADADTARDIAGVLEGTQMLQRSRDGKDTAWVVTDPGDWSRVHASDADTPTRAADRREGRRLVKEVSLALARVVTRAPRS